MECRHLGSHVYVALGYVFDYVTIACALRWGIALVGDYHYWLCSPRRGTPLSGTGQVKTVDPHSGPHI